MKIKTKELSGTALDWAVATAEGATDLRHDTVATWWMTLHGQDIALKQGWAQSYCPSTDWSCAGPIIEREGTFRIIGPKVRGTAGYVVRLPKGANDWHEATGPTPLIAAMRCFVASKLGEEVDVPGELLPK